MGGGVGGGAGDGVIYVRGAGVDTHVLRPSVVNGPLRKII